MVVVINFYSINTFAGNKRPVAFNNVLDDAGKHTDFVQS